MGFQTRRAMAMTPEQIRHIRDVGDAMEASFIAQNNKVPNLAGLLAHQERGRRAPDNAVGSPRQKVLRIHPARVMRPRTSESGPEDVSTDSEEEAALHVARREDENVPEEGEVSLVTSYSLVTHACRWPWTRPVRPSSAAARSLWWAALLLTRLPPSAQDRTKMARAPRERGCAWQGPQPHAVPRRVRREGQAVRAGQQVRRQVVSFPPH